MPEPSHAAAPFPGRVVAIGASAGGLEALLQVLGPLPADYALPILVVQHLSRDHRSRLAELLQTRAQLRIGQAVDGEPIARGHVYIAPPDRHLEIEPSGRIRLGGEPPVRFSRPSVDVLFGSLAEYFGANAVAVVLTGAGSDGANGVRAVHEAGGLVIVQDQSSSLNSGMPSSAIDTGILDHVLPLTAIAPFLKGLDAHLESVS